MKNLKSNKEIVLSFYQEVVGKRNTELAKQIIAEDYIQHNPMVKTGLGGVLEAIEFLKQLPIKKPTETPIKRIFSENEYVVVHLLIEMGNTKQLVMDLFRLENGQIVEHWDAIQNFVDETKNGNTMVDGITEITDDESLVNNKSIVKEFVDSIILKQEVDRTRDFVDKNLIQHHPEIDNGLAGLKEYLSNSERLNIAEVHRIIGEGNFVLVQSRGIKEPSAWVVYDLYRLENEKIMEQWTVSQEIPEKMAHDNGMI